MVDYTLKSYGGVSKSYKYNLVLKVPITSSKGYFLFVSFFNSDIPESLREVKPSKPSYFY